MTKHPLGRGDHENTGGPLRLCLQCIYVHIPMVCVTDLRGVNTVLAEVTTEDKQDGLSMMRIFVLFSNKSSGADSLKSSCNKFLKIKKERKEKEAYGNIWH